MIFCPVCTCRRHRQGRSIRERKAIADRDHALSLTRQAALLGISRGSLHYESRPTSDAALALMRRIDELHLDYPFGGSRMLAGLLRQDGHAVGRLHISTLMKKMGIEAIYRRPNTSKPTPGHKVYTYLQRKLPVTRPNQVLRTASGRWTSRTSPWRAGSCIWRLSTAWRPLCGVTNIFVERLWQTIKYEEVYLRAYATVSEARALIGRYLAFYNGRRPHSSLGGRTPDQAYLNPQQPITAAA